MTIRLGDEAPDFTAETTDGTLSFHDWKDGSWAVLFSHPADFTPVCTTELGYTAKLKGEFEKRGAKALVISVDTLEHHRAWSEDIAETAGRPRQLPDHRRYRPQGRDPLQHDPPDADPKLTVRAVYVIDPNKKIRASIVYPPEHGRNFDEVLRLLNSLQITDGYQRRYARQLDPRRPGDRVPGPVDGRCHRALR